MQLFTHIRMAHSFSNYKTRLACVMTRLQAYSILIYSQSAPETILPSSFIDECITILKSDKLDLMDIKTEIFKTLTCVIFLERQPK